MVNVSLSYWIRHQRRRAVRLVVVVANHVGGKQCIHWAADRPSVLILQHFSYHRGPAHVREIIDGLVLPGINHCSCRSVGI